MPAYSRGKIYKITSGEMTYIGSTCEPTLARRMANHVCGYKRWKEGFGGKVTSYDLIERGDYEITLIELCPCNSRDELNARERFHIKNTPCVNRNQPGRTFQEYYQDNKEQIEAKVMAYREDHKQEYIDYQKAYRETHRDKARVESAKWRQRKVGGSEP
jgi:hypothetical protein